MIRTRAGESAKVLANLGSCTAMNGAGVEIKERTTKSLKQKSTLHALKSFATIGTKKPKTKTRRNGAKK